MKAFEQGKKGFYYNKDNPFKQDTYNYKEWERGFNKAYFENLRKINGKEKFGAGS